MEKVDLISLYFNKLDRTKIKKSTIGKEFEFLLLEEFFKEAFKPVLENKSFAQRMYWEQFIITVSEILATKDPLKLEKTFENYLKRYEDTSS